MSEGKKYQIKYSGDGLPSTKVRAIYDPIVQELANDFEINIEIITCHGNQSFIPPEMDYEKFYILVQMAPAHCKVAADTVVKVNMGDSKLTVIGGQTDTLKTVGEKPKDITVITDKDGKELAIVHDATLYFLNDFIHCHNQKELDNSIEMFKYVINEATKTPELLRALKSGTEEKGKRSLEVALKKQFTERLKKERIQLESASAIIDNYTQELTKASRKITSTQSIIEAIQKNLESIPLALDKKWVSTKKLEGGQLFESISFQRNSVKGITTPIFAMDKKIWYQMGRFEITLSFDGNVRIMSMWSERGPLYQHPHVNTDGRPCWGNLSGELPKRIGESEFDVAFVEIHTFLCHYSQEGGPYTNIDNWPKATTEQIEMLKSDKVKS